MFVVGGLIALGVAFLLVIAFRLGRRVPRKTYIVVGFYPTEVTVFASNAQAQKHAAEHSGKVYARTVKPEVPPR